LELEDELEEKSKKLQQLISPDGISKLLDAIEESI
jgi:hypothetical protein